LRLNHLHSLSDQDDKAPAVANIVGAAVSGSHVEAGICLPDRAVDQLTLKKVEQGRSNDPMVSVVECTRSRSSASIDFGEAGTFAARPQVYNQKLVYRMMIIVNGTTLLWISRVLSTTSNVYGSHKAVGWSCMFLVAKLDKKRRCAKSRVSSQSVPVDIHTLIHRLRTLIRR